MAGRVRRGAVAVAVYPGKRRFLFSANFSSYIQHAVRVPCNELDVIIIIIIIFSFIIITVRYRN